MSTLTPPEPSSDASSGRSSDSSAWANTFEQFWPLYLAEHSSQRTRRWHYLGTLVGVGAGLMVFGYQYARNSLIEALLIGAFAEFVVSYGLLVLSHWVVEGNSPAAPYASGKPRPQIAKELWWSVRADFKLLSLAFREEVEDEYARHSLSYRQS